MEPDTSEATSTLRLRQKVKWDKLDALYRLLGVTGNPTDLYLDRLGLRRIQKRDHIFWVLQRW